MYLFTGTGECSGTGGTDGWICQHRWVAVSGMVGFKNNVGSAALNDWVSPQSEQIAFGRGRQYNAFLSLATIIFVNAAM